MFERNQGGTNDRGEVAELTARLMVQQMTGLGPLWILMEMLYCRCSLPYYDHNNDLL